MKGSIAPYFPTIFVVTLVFIFFNAVVSFYNLQTLLDSEKLTTHTQQVIFSLNSLDLWLKESELNQRNLLIIGQDEFLQKFNDNIAQAEKEIKTLRFLVSDNSEQTKRVDALKILIQQKIDFLQKTNQVFANEGIEQAQDYISLGQGVQKSKQINLKLKEMENQEKSLLEERHVSSLDSANKTYTTILIATFFNILLIFITYLLTVRELDARALRESRKDEFISIATHELKTPITSLQVYAQILEKKLKKTGDKDDKQYITSILTQIGRLSLLVNDLLDVSRLQLKKMFFAKTYFDLNSLVRSTTFSLKDISSHHIIKIQGHVKGKVYADSDRIGQVLLNLIANAIKYSPEGKKIIISLAEQKARAVVGVRDFGIGIEEEDQKYIFQRFYRAEGESQAKFSGLGIGLYISQEIIKRNNGRIWVESKVGEGSVFYFSLPLNKTKIPAARAK